MDERRALLVVVLWLAVSVEMRWCLEYVKETAESAAGTMKETAESAAETVKSKVGEAKQSAAEAMQDAKDKSGSWADWAYGKFTE